uniref:type IV secretion system protein n=1 Tax=Burkholderia arboris TaxID=488730 RepID=UPI003BEED1FB
MDETLNGLLETTLNGMISSGNGMGGTLISTGIEIFGGLVFLRLVWMWLEYLLDARSFEEFGKIVIWTTLRIGFISYLLATYTTMAGVTGLFMQGPDYLVQKITGQSSANVFTSGLTHFNTIVNSMDDAVIKTHGATSATDTSATTADSSSGISISLDRANANLKKTWDNLKMAVMNPMQFFAQAIDGVLGLGAKIMLGAATLVYVVTYAIGTVMLYVGIAMGPVMIPWKVLDQSEFLFDGWLRYTIGAGLYKVVCAIVITLVGGGVSALATAVRSLNLTGSSALGYDITAFVLVLLLCGFLILVLWEVPKIAGGLVSGSASLSLRIRIR